MMNAATGRALDEAAHIAQSIGDILTTRIGTRIKRRDYGSLVPAMIDQPGNEATLLRLKAAAIMGINRWEPRIRINRVGFTVAMDGSATLSLEGQRVGGPRSGQNLTLDIPVR